VIATLISTQFLNALVRGVETAAIYAIFALGLVVVFEATGVFNFAQGETFMAGGVLGLILWQSHGVPVLGAFLLAVIVSAGIAAVTERVGVRPALKVKNSEAYLLATLGASLIASSAFAIATARPGDTGTRQFPRYLPGKPVYRISGVIIETNRAFVVVVALATALALGYFLRRTQTGRALRAIAADREGASMRGLPVARLGLIAFAIGGAIGGIGGFAAGPVTTASVYAGLPFLIKGFMAGAVGGFSLPGALLGGLVLGISEQMTAVYTDGRFAQLITLGTLLAVLSVRPGGLIGTKGRVV
jgi:branched-chain amino acid transport system permease protein